MKARGIEQRGVTGGDFQGVTGIAPREQVFLIMNKPAHREHCVPPYWRNWNMNPALELISVFILISTAVTSVFTSIQGAAWQRVARTTCAKGNASHSRCGVEHNSCPSQKLNTVYITCLVLHLLLSIPRTKPCWIHLPNLSCSTT